MERRRTIVPSRWGRVLLATLGLAAAGSAWAFARAVENAAEKARAASLAAARLAERGRVVAARGAWADRRRRLVAALAEEIARANPRLHPHRAAHYARLVVRAHEKYPRVLPALFTAVGIVESSYDERARSPVDARGLYQIWPPTGRRLAAVLDRRFEMEMLYDAETNTELAAFYLERLVRRHGDERVALAEYNGGPVNARRLRRGGHGLASETKEYVAKVVRTKAALERRLADGEARLAAGSSP